jgi:hypothetical protein
LVDGVAEKVPLPVENGETPFQEGPVKAGI